MSAFYKFSLKILLSCVMFFVLSMSLTAQAKIYYSYDGNGNRLTRSITLKKNAIVNDSLSEKEIEKEILKEEIGEIQVRIFPNPTHGELIIGISGLSYEIPIEYSVFSLTGTLLKKQKVSEHQLSIDFNNYPSGIYFLKLKLEGKVSEWKIIKE